MRYPPSPGSYRSSVKVSPEIGARTDSPSHSPAGTSVAPEAGSLPSARHSGGGEKMPWRRPGAASPRPPSTTAEDAGRTTWTGSLGAGLYTEAYSMEDQNGPLAPVRRVARPPSNETVLSMPVPVTVASTA